MDVEIRLASDLEAEAQGLDFRWGYVFRVACRGAVAFVQGAPFAYDFAGMLERAQVNRGE